MRTEPLVTRCLIDRKVRRVNLLTAETILQSLDADTSIAIENVEVLAEIGSTNSYLLEQERPAPGRFKVVVAEHQTAGRGQMGRQWVTTPGSCVCLSASYSFLRSPSQLSCLSIAIGVGIANALAELNISGIRLKWPNDLFVNDRKVGGILCEVVPGKSEYESVVVGVGLNVDLEEGAQWPDCAADIQSCSPNLVQKTDVVLALIDGLLRSLTSFADKGLLPFIESWDRLDWLRGRQITASTSEGQLAGKAQGIDQDGALLLDTGTGTKRIISGSVRPM